MLLFVAGRTEEVIFELESQMITTDIPLTQVWFRFWNFRKFDVKDRSKSFEQDVFQIM